MKLSKQALIAAAVTGMLPSGVEAAALNQNLVLNPSFENVVSGNALNWDGNVSTYAYALNYTLAGPAGSGSRYWYGGTADPLSRQLIDLTGNAALIDAASVNYNLSAFFSTYQNQHDNGTVRAIFLNAGNQQLGNAITIGGLTFVDAIPAGPPPGFREWREDSLSGVVPAGTRMVRLELDGEKEIGIGSIADGYIDLVNFQIVAVPEPGMISLFALGLVGGWTFLRHSRRKV